LDQDIQETASKVREFQGPPKCWEISRLKEEMERLRKIEKHFEEEKKKDGTRLKKLGKL
jgi:hypothetical protein